VALDVDGLAEAFYGVSLGITHWVEHSHAQGTMGTKAAHQREQPKCKENANQ